MFIFDADPLVNFKNLFESATNGKEGAATEHAAKVPEANAMALATVGKNGSPSVRIVYYKGMVREGFSFYTNYQGRKAQDLAANPHVAANFFWPELSQQVRLEGHVEKLTAAESEAYFRTRARISQIGAWASDQSHEIANHDVLLKKYEMFEKKFKGQDVPCPSHWGGYRILAAEIEFWFGRNGRLHERYVYPASKHGLCVAPVYAIAVIKMKFLVSGFQPFLKNQVNISQQVIETLAKTKLCSTVLLPVEFETAFIKLQSEIERAQPDVVLMLGLASGRKKISLEKVALNWVETTEPDNSEKIPQVGFITPYKELALMTPINWTELMPKFSKEFVEISFSAGTYVCNDLYFRTLAFLQERQHLQIRASFIHLPAASPGFDEAQITATVQDIIRAVAGRSSM